MTTDSLRYPIGRFDYSAPVTADMRDPAILILAGMPSRLRDAVAELMPAQMDIPYRPGGWTVRQVVHHVVDSHVNAYIRTKLALTEDEPAITPYDQDSWATLPDARLPVEVSLGMLDGLHRRWTEVWRSLAPPQFLRTFHHPEIGVVTLDAQLQAYAWHCRHHLAHIVGLRERERW